MDSPKKTGRLAGLLYLTLIGCGFFYLRYVPSALKAHNDSTSPISNLLNNDTLFRLGILVEVLSNVIFLILSFAFYKLLNKVNKVHAVLMVSLVAIAVVLSFISLQNKFTVLTLLNQHDLLTPLQLKTQVFLYLSLYKNGIILGEIFWGLWLFPLGYLVFKSGFLPKFIGIILMVGCFGYLADFTGTFFFPHYNDTSLSNYVTLPASIGELCICLWLLIIGVKSKKLDAAL